MFGTCGHMALVAYVLISGWLPSPFVVLELSYPDRVVKVKIVDPYERGSCLVGL